MIAPNVAFPWIQAVRLPMSEVFISYSRRDQAFVEQLRSRLEDAGLGVWVDVEGLYAGEEFWPEVARAIDAALAFVFVMSPDSTVSRFCGLEVERAIAGQKRIVPLCHRDVNADELNPALASRQWVFFRKKDDPAAAEAALLSAIRADWEWLRTQARLLARAQEWKQKDEDTSLLLRGSELREAEGWLRDSIARETGATPLHSEYITVSRRATRRRRLRLTGAAGLTLLTVALVSWFGLSQRVASLNNLSLDDLNRGQVDAAIDKLEAAQGVCARFGSVFGGCADARMNLGRAFLDAGRYRDALDQFTRLIHDAQENWPGGALAADFLATAYQNRTFGRIMVAETYTDDSKRLHEYARAEDDLDAAAQFYQRTADGAGGRIRPVEITRARIHIGRGEYAQALGQLERARRFSNQPDISLLLSIVYHCLGNGLKSVEYLTSYIDALPGSVEDPHWLRNKGYYRGLRERCANTAG
jgi:tetratricopeptide (TPR) repeat protein